ncbi:MAG: hypothetical protein IBX56_17195 [Methylomicrobium sp.]|nr:hypothetical protein [Methylomicrobium sp.]
MADLKTIVLGTDKAQSDAINEAGNVLQQAAANRLLRSVQAGADQAIKAHSNKRFQELDIQARYGQLPELLSLEAIAYLMGEPVEPFVQFMEKTGLKYEIKKATKAYGAFETGLMLTGSLGVFFCNKADVKNWLQSMGKWPINGPLANWWKEDKPEHHANPYASS